MSVRGVPVQELPENQDPSVAYVLDEVTRVKTPLVVPSPEPVSTEASQPEVPAEAPKRRGRKPKAEPPADADVVAEEAEAPVEEPVED